MRRDLRFKTLSEVEAELDRLDGQAIETTGKWSFYQILDHIAAGAEWAMSETPRGFAETGGSADLKPEIKRKFYERIARSGKIQAGVPNPNAPDEFEDGDAAAQMTRLRAALGRLKSHTAPFPDEHPFLGKLAPDEWRVWCAAHCAHHLGYARIRGN